MEAISIEPLAALRDNYIWALSRDTDAVVVDPGEAQPVERWLAGNGRRLEAILLTHHHPDHTGGVAELRRRHRARIYGPRADHIAGLDVGLGEGDEFSPAPGWPRFRVLEIAGHTSGHIAYYGAESLFSGDTLFSAGCGRLFEGTPEEMLHSLSRLAALPGSTRVYCGHEYTVANLRFACHVLPEDRRLEKALANALKIRENGKVTLPSCIDREREINLFLRTDEETLRTAVERHAATALASPTEVFAALRRWKDEFRGA